MNRFIQKGTFHGRAIGSLITVGASAFAVYSAGIMMYVSDRWRNGTSRVYDPPIWDSVSEERKTEIISSRQQIIATIRDMYQMQHKRTDDSLVMPLFIKNCVLEDPYYRFIGPKEILRAFANLHRKNKYITFKVYDPTHYKDAIIIKCEREFEHTSMNTYMKRKPRVILSNLAVHLVVDESGREKIGYIADEWNYVSLVQPETHDAFIFAGSVARLLRRIPSALTHIYLEENRSLFNPLRLVDAINECFDFVSRKFHATEEKASEPSNLESSDPPKPNDSFNAGVRNT